MKQQQVRYYGTCKICGSPTDGRYKRDDDLYCKSDYDKTSALEKTMNKLINEKEKIFKKLFDTTR